MSDEIISKLSHESECSEHFSHQSNSLCISHGSINTSSIDQLTVHIDNRFKERSLYGVLTLSLKHVFWVFFTSLPSIVFVTLIGFANSRLPWTHSPCINMTNATGEGTAACSYYNGLVLFIFDDVIRSMLLAAIPVLILSVMIKKWKFLVKTLLLAAFPWFVASFSAFLFIYMFHEIWYYHFDVAIFVSLFLVTTITALFILSKERTDIDIIQLLKHVFCPVLVVALGMGFVDVYLIRKYRLEMLGSWQKLFIRIIAFPIFADCLISFFEWNIRKVKFCEIQLRAHVVYICQVAIGIMGRYMTTTAGDLKDIAITALCLAIKDVFMHRMSRVQCWLAFHLKSLLRKCRRVNETEPSFIVWFTREEFKSFRANVLNSELVAELTALLVVPVMIISFEKHKLLFNFGHEGFFMKNGEIDIEFTTKQEAIQVISLFSSFVAVAFVEARFNGVDLRIAYKQISLLQQASQIIMLLWASLLLLSSVRLLPNYFQCKHNDICSCDFQIVKTEYGCRV